MKAYYNEYDPKTAAWLRELIRDGHIAPGDVDERSIEDVLPSELTGYTQCHFFAGVGVWSAALRGAGWPDSRPVWTGSCPCQPFSAAGKGKGIADERHLWPAFYWLIEQCQPVAVFGEQVASKDGITWFDDVQSDLEAKNYAVGGFDLPAAGFGAPHIRQRLFFVADAARNDEQRIRQSGERIRRGQLSAGGFGAVGIVADATGQRYDGWRAIETSRRTGELERPRDVSELGNAQREGLQERIEYGGILSRTIRPSEREVTISRSATNGFWADAEWIYCQDGKYRPTKPGVFPLAHGVANRMVKLRGCGNAIVKEVAQEFIKVYLEEELSHT